MKQTGDVIHTITVGWKSKPGAQIAHFWKSNTFAKIAMSSCGEIATKVSLTSKPEAIRCLSCEWKRQHRQDLKGFVERS